MFDHRNVKQKFPVGIGRPRRVKPMALEEWMNWNFDESRPEKSAGGLAISRI